MKVKMIGTGAIDGPYKSASCLIDNKILIDCGNGIVKSLTSQKVNINKLKYLFITHLHGDHYLDIPFLLLERSWNNPEDKLTIYAQIGSKNIFEKILKLSFGNKYNLNILLEKANAEIIEFNKLNNINFYKNYTVTALPVIHGNLKHAYGYILSDGKSTLGLSGDSSYCQSIDKIFETSNTVILDMTMEKENSNHMGLNTIIKLSKKYDKKIITTHMSMDVRKKANKLNLKNVIIPVDGDIFNI